jgi:hypothetical protein
MIHRKQQRSGRAAAGFIAALALLALTFLETAPSIAGDTWIASSVTSYHFDRSAGYNERNWGVGIERGIAPDVRLIAGVYRNSLYRESTYAGASWTPFAAGPVRLGVLAGVVDGYKADHGRFVPIAMPLVTYEIGRAGANLIYLPHYKDDGGVIGLQLKYRFN